AGGAVQPRAARAPLELCGLRCLFQGLTRAEQRTHVDPIVRLRDGRNGRGHGHGLCFLCYVLVIEPCVRSNRTTALGFTARFERRNALGLPRSDERCRHTCVLLSCILPRDSFVAPLHAWDSPIPRKTGSVDGPLVPLAE